VEIKQNNKLVQIVDTDTGTQISLKPGQYDIGLRDTKNEQLTVSHDSVTLRRGTQTIVKVKYNAKESSGKDFGAKVKITDVDSGQTERPVERVIGNVPKMPVNLSLFLKPYKLNANRLVMVNDHHWSVSTSYRGTGADGKKVTDERITLFISNSDKSFSAAIIRLNRETAAQVVNDLNKLLAERNDRPELTDQMLVTLATIPYKLDVNRVVHLAEENLTCEVRPSYVSVDENNRSSVENRITLHLEDTKNAFWPLIVRMNDSVALQLSADIMAALEKPPTAELKLPPNAVSYVGTYEDSNGRKLELKLENSQIHYAISWGRNDPVSRGQLVQTPEGVLQLQQPGDTTRITVKLSADQKTVTTISFLDLDFDRK